MKKRSTKLGGKNPWVSLQDGKCFFVPTIAPHDHAPILRQMGYIFRTDPAHVEVGVLDGKLGVLCYRTKRPVLGSVSEP